VKGGRTEVYVGGGDAAPLPGLDLSRRMAGLMLMHNEAEWRFSFGGLEANGRIPNNLTKMLMLDMARPGRGSPEWHSDYTIQSGREALQPKLVAVIQCSRPTDYSGGQLEIYSGERILTGSRDRGDMVIFPSFLLHRRLPVTRGGRLALIAVLHGPPFR
jgi:hypothetical protein